MINALTEANTRPSSGEDSAGPAEKTLMEDFLEKATL